MKTKIFYLLPFFLLCLALILFITCKEKPTAPVFNNPLDSQNPDTRGDPFHLQAAIVTDGVTLSWTLLEIVGLAGYAIYKSSFQNTGYSKIFQVNAKSNSYLDISVRNGSEYWYKVSALSSENQESEKSPINGLLVAVSGLPNRPPIASFFVQPTDGLVETEFIFSADSSYDIEDEKSQLMVRWDWENDNIWDTEYTTNKTASHKYSTGGTKTIKLEVKDTEGATSTTTRQAAVKLVMIDFDGNIYKTVKIGNQWWMAENLKVTHYRNGDAIANVTDNSAWTSLSTGAYCNYDNNEANVAIYGRLYNWYAVNDGRKIAPVGWHVPTAVEWQILVDYLGGDNVAGGKLKEAGYTHWSSPNTDATNKSGFTALPGGCRGGYGGYFTDMGSNAYFWSAPENGSGYAWFRYLYCGSSDVYSYYGNKRDGFSVRLVRD